MEGEPEVELTGSDTREEESNDAPSIVLLNRRVHVSPVAASTETAGLRLGAFSQKNICKKLTWQLLLFLFKNNNSATLLDFKMTSGPPQCFTTA